MEREDSCGLRHRQERHHGDRTRMKLFPDVLAGRTAKVYFLQRLRRMKRDTFDSIKTAVLHLVYMCLFKSSK